MMFSGDWKEVIVKCICNKMIYNIFYILDGSIRQIIYICVINESYESSCEISTIFFLLVAFLLGSLAPLYGNVFNFVLLAFMMVLFGINGKEMLRNLRYVRGYIGINVAF